MRGAPTAFRLQDGRWATGPGEVAIDVAGRKPRWRRPAHETDTLVGLGSRTLATSLSGTAASVLYTADGRQLLGSEDAASVAGVASEGGLLLFSDALSPYPAEESLVGLRVGDASRTALGRLGKVRSQGCSWNARFLVCPAEKDFQVWQYAD